MGARGAVAILYRGSNTLGALSSLLAYVSLFSLQPVLCVPCSSRGTNLQLPTRPNTSTSFQTPSLRPAKASRRHHDGFLVVLPLRNLSANSQDLWMTSSSRAARERG